MTLGELLADSVLFFALSLAAVVVLLIGQHLLDERGLSKSSRGPANPGGEGTHEERFRSTSRCRSRRVVHARRRRAAPLKALALCGVNGYAALATWLLTGRGLTVLVPLALGLVATIAATQLLQNFSVGGRLLVVNYVLLSLFGAAWGAWFVATIPVSTLTRALICAAYPFLVLMVPSALIIMLEDWEVLCRKNWLRPRTPLPVTPRDRYPKVSLHVPTYSEPPEIVIATLDTLASLH